MIPSDFDELAEDLDLFYRIEPDGSVLLTGEKNKVLFNHTLKDGSRLSGGINRNGMLFGERIANIRGQIVKFQLHWRDPTPSPALNTRMVKPPSSSSVLDGAQFNPRNPTSWQPGLTPQLPPSSRVTPETRQLVQEAGVEVAELRDSGERIAKAIKAETKPKGKIAKQMSKLLGREEEGGSGGNLDVLVEASEVIEKTLLEVQKVRADNATVAQELARLEAENAALRNEVERISGAAQDALKKTNEEWARKFKVRRWQVEGVRTQEVTTEGMESRMLEVEDPAGELHYVVVSTAPKNTPQEVLKQWQDDLRAKVDLMPLGRRAVYVLAPEGVQVQVLELIPGVDIDDSQAQL